MPPGLVKGCHPGAVMGGVEHLGACTEEVGEL